MDLIQAKQAGAGKFLHCHCGCLSVCEWFPFSFSIAETLPCLRRRVWCLGSSMPRLNSLSPFPPPHPASCPLSSQSWPTPPFSQTLCLENSDSNVALHSGSISMARPVDLARWLPLVPTDPRFIRIVHLPLSWSNLLLFSRSLNSPRSFQKTVPYTALLLRNDRCLSASHLQETFLKTVFVEHEFLCCCC